MFQAEFFSGKIGIKTKTNPNKEKIYIGILTNLGKAKLVFIHCNSILKTLRGLNPTKVLIFTLAYLYY